MRNLTISEMFAVNGAQNNESGKYSINWSHAGLDMAGGAIIGGLSWGIASGLYHLTVSQSDVVLNGLLGLAYGSVKGIIAGATIGGLFAFANEVKCDCQ